MRVHIVGPARIADQFGTYEPGEIVERPSADLMRLVTNETINPESGLPFAENADAPNAEQIEVIDEQPVRVAPDTGMAVEAQAEAESRKLAQTDEESARRAQKRSGRTAREAQD